MMKRLLLLFLICVFADASAQHVKRLSLLFLGDIMQHDSQIADAYDPASKTYDYKPCFQYVKPYTQAVDLAIGNLELTTAGPPYKGYPQFGAPDELLVALKDMGMDVLVTANNHCVDRGRKGLERTIHMLDSFEILHTGTFVDAKQKEQLHPLLIEKDSFRLALLNYTYGTNGLPVTQPNIVNMIEPEKIVKDLSHARSLKPDAIIVFIHWGSEYQSQPSQWQKDLGKLMFKNGADIIIGAHPHVIQPMAWDKNANQLITYSLGNFVSGQRKRYTDGGAMIRLELEKKFVNDSVTSTRVDTAGYILEWVHRDVQKNYFVMPVPSVDAKLVKAKLDETSRAAYKTFVDDSRALLDQQNIDIAEYKSPPAYFISVPVDGIDTLKIKNVIGNDVGLKMQQDSTSHVIQVGPLTLPDAEHLKQKLGVRADILLKQD